MSTDPDWPALAAALTRDLGEPLSEEERYHRLLSTIRQVLPFDAAAMLRLEGDTLVPLAALGLGEEVLGRRFMPGAHPRLAHILTSAQPVRFGADSQLPDPYDGLVEGVAELLPVHDCMGARLQIQGRTWGVLTLDALTPGAFGHIEPRMLQRLVQWVEACVHTAETLAALRERVAREHQVHQALHAERASRALVGKSPALQTLREEMATVAQSDLSVLILGETGVGKELVAERLHADSRRKDAPLVQINCAALPENLAESELFGHRKGAYTGATHDRIGKFELAHGGTLLLDEIGELSLPIQAKLLRVLQSGEVQRPGSDRPVRVDVRILAATNRELREEVARGRFRADLYHRLSVFPLRVPPLRERGKDVLTLAGTFLEENQHRLGARNLRLTAAAKEALLRHSWPGNVRELEHVMSRAALRALAQQGRAVRWIVIDEAQLGLENNADTAAVRAIQPHPAQALASSGPGLREATDVFQRQWLQAALARHKGNQAAVAREAGMHRSNLFRLIKRLGVQA